MIISTQVRRFCLLDMQYLGIQQLEARRRNFARKTLQREEEAGCAAVPSCFHKPSHWCPMRVFLFQSEFGWFLLLMEEILHQLIGSLSHYLQGFLHPRWCRISSINSITEDLNLMIFCDSLTWKWATLKRFTSTVAPAMCTLNKRVRWRVSHYP